MRLLGVDDGMLLPGPGPCPSDFAPRFHCILLAPGLIGRRARYPPGMPLGKGTLPNLEIAKGDVLATRGQVTLHEASG